MRTLRRRLLPPLLLAVVLLGVGCSPFYLLRAGWHEARILSRREPITRLVRDTAVDPGLREKLALALDVRGFARDSLGLDVGDAYLTYSELEKDTLALVLSAAHPDRLESLTWWFPIVGRIPYRAYFDFEDARERERELSEDGYDTYLRPTAAFSTLGWFADPLLSTVVRRDAVGMAESIIHELAHQTVWISGHTRFNESLAAFVGAAGAAAYFCRGTAEGVAAIDGAPSDAVSEEDARCALARDRWADDRRFSRFLDGVVEELTTLYARDDLSTEETLVRKGAIFSGAKERFREVVRPELRAHRFSFFTDLPLNNAVLLARMRYYHRLYDFGTFLERRGGGLREAVEVIGEEAPGTEDPFRMLEGNG